MFRLLSVGGRAALEHAGGVYDVARLSADASLSSALACLERADELHALARRCPDAAPDAALADVVLGPPVPEPRQVFGIGLNYRSHAAESGMELPPSPLTFTKFPSCLAGPTADVTLSGAMVDYEAEVVVVIGARCRNVPEDRAWAVVAGITAGQDISDRQVQLSGSPPQFCLGKSFTGYGPTGPALVSVDAFADPDDIALRCEVGGEVVQDASTADVEEIHRDVWRLRVPGDRVRIVARGGDDFLPLLDLFECAQQVAITRGLLVAFFARCILHALLEAFD